MNNSSVSMKGQMREGPKRDQWSLAHDLDEPYTHYW